MCSFAKFELCVWLRFTLDEMRTQKEKRKKKKSWTRFNSTHWHQQKQLGLCVLWSQQRVEYIWTPNIMAHRTIMWCGNGRETTCHCGWERDSRTEARPRARPALQFTFNCSLSLFCSVCLCHLSLSLVLSLTSASCFLIPLRVSRCLSNISCFSLLLSLNVFLIFPDLTRGLLPPKECPAQAKAILWLFFERDNDNPGS